MAEPPAALTTHVRNFALGAAPVLAAFIEDMPAVALADGGVVLGEPEALRRIEAHANGAILNAVADGARLLTGGDDGRVMLLGADGQTKEIAHEKGALDRRLGDARPKSRLGGGTRGARPR